MSTSLAESTEIFDARFLIDAEAGLILVESEADHWAAFEAERTARLNKYGDRVRLAVGHDVHLLLSPAEALTVAAALQAVAIDMLEQQPREIRRRTEAGAPAFEESI